MSLIALLTLLTVFVAAIPLFVGRTRLIFNPALMVFAVVTWSVLLKVLYVVILRPGPLNGVHDTVYVWARSIDFIVPGLLVVLLSVVSYTAGYLVVSRRGSHTLGIPDGRILSAPGRSRWILIGLGVVCLAAFIGYLQVSEQSFFSIPFSSKRFQQREMGVTSRFLYVPYYFFKIALTSGSVTYAATVLFVSSRNRVEERRNMVIVFVLFLFVLAVAHFASLRLFILLVLAQVVFLVFYFGNRRRLLFVAILGILTLGSTAAITFVHRAPTGRRVVSSPVTPKTETVVASKDAGTSSPLPPKVVASMGNQRSETESLELSSEGAGAIVSEDEHPGQSEREPDSPYPGPDSVQTSSMDDQSRESENQRSSEEPMEISAGGSGLEGAGRVESVSNDTPVPSGPALDGSKPREPPGESVSEEQPRWVPIKERGLRRLATTVFEGRYFMDVTKLAHIVSHFPSKHSFLEGQSLIGSSISPPGRSGEALRLTRYLATYVFDEKLNNVTPGFSGELYVNFGWIGLFVGFLMLGALHRIVYNALVAGQPIVLVGILIVISLNTSLVLLNSGMISTIARTMIDVLVIGLICVPSFWSGNEDRVGTPSR